MSRRSPYTDVKKESLYRCQQGVLIQMSTRSPNTDVNKESLYRCQQGVLIQMCLSTRSPYTDVNKESLYRCVCQQGVLIQISIPEVAHGPACEAVTIDKWFVGLSTHSGCCRQVVLLRNTTQWDSVNTTLFNAKFC